MAKTCGHAAVMEWNGDVYSCDHFVFPEYRLGNILSDNLISMMGSDRQLKFGEDKRDKLPRQCTECQFLFACNGECPKIGSLSQLMENKGLTTCARDTGGSFITPNRTWTSWQTSYGTSVPVKGHDPLPEMISVYPD